MQYDWITQQKQISREKGKEFDVGIFAFLSFCLRLGSRTAYDNKQGWDSLEPQEDDIPF